MEAIRLLNENNFKTAVVSNQAGIARGFYTPNDVHVLHDYIQRELRKHKAAIDAFFYCPHHQEAVTEEFRKNCDCRKPNTGMIKQAQAKWELDLESSYIIGDAMSDIGLGKNAGLRTILVETGYGKETLRKITSEKIAIEHVAENILEAVKYILKRIPNDKSQINPKHQMTNPK